MDLVRPPQLGTVAYLHQEFRRWRQRRALRRAWARLSPGEQFGHFIGMLKVDAGLRKEFRQALAVRSAEDEARHEPRIHRV